MTRDKLKLIKIVFSRHQGLLKTDRYWLRDQCELEKISYDDAGLKNVRRPTLFSKQSTNTEDYTLIQAVALKN